MARVAGPDRPAGRDDETAEEGAETSDGEERNADGAVPVEDADGSEPPEDAAPR